MSRAHLITFAALRRVWLGPSEGGARYEKVEKASLARLEVSTMYYSSTQLAITIFQRFWDPAVTNSCPVISLQLSLIGSHISSCK